MGGNHSQDNHVSPVASRRDFASLVPTTTTTTTTRVISFFFWKCFWFWLPNQRFWLPNQTFWLPNQRFCLPNHSSRIRPFGYRIRRRPSHLHCHARPNPRSGDSAARGQSGAGEGAAERSAGERSPAEVSGAASGEAVKAATWGPLAPWGRSVFFWLAHVSERKVVWITPQTEAGRS